MNTDDFSAKGRLVSYLALFLKGEMGAQAFAGSFEQVYNLELNKTALSPQEAEALADLFEKAAWFSPIESDCDKIPNYVGERELLVAAQRARSKLNDCSIG